MKPGSGNGACIDADGFPEKRRKTLQSNHLTIFFLIGFFLILFIGCGKNKTEVAGGVFDPEKTPVVHTEDVSTLISDSGITRYRVQARVWDIFSRAKEPYWYFPQKIYVERFDTLFDVEGSIVADTAYFLTQKKLWHLIGNVKVINLEGETFETSELYWDQNRAEVYTDKFVKVQRKDEEITGTGFRSNQEMTSFSFYKSGVLLNIKDDEEKKDTIPPGDTK